jgi:hypothetical protein
MAKRKSLPTNPFDRLRGMSLRSGLIVKSLASPPPVTFEEFPPEVRRRVYELLFPARCCTAGHGRLERTGSQSMLINLDTIAGRYIRIARGQSADFP